MKPLETQTVNSYPLTVEQQQVVVHDMTKPAKVIAVAGAGKTTTLISRIEYLLAQGVEASRIGVFMFNKSAQEEFSQRLNVRLQSAGFSSQPSVMTFHGFGMKLCRRLEQQSLLPSAKLLTDDFSLVKLIREALQRLLRQGVKISLQDEKDWLEDVLLFIEQVKASGDSAEQVFAAMSWSKERAFFVPLYQQLEQLRKRDKVRFFSDLLSDPLALIKDMDDSERHRVRGQLPNFSHLLIDEFQDINPCQYELLKQLYGASCQWMIVGDVQQCIYEWRGAKPSIMAEQFDAEFAPVTTYPLSQSFRFGHAIGLMASSVISENDKNSLVLGAGDHTRVAFARAPKVGKALLGELKAWLEEGQNLNDCAVLVRLYSDMVPIQLALMHKKLPYQLHGDSPLLENRQIRMLMAYMAVMAGGLEDTRLFFDANDVEYLLTVPSLGLAAPQRNLLIQQAKQAVHLLPQMIENLADSTEGWRAKKLYERADWLRSLSVYKADPAQGLQHTIDKLGIYRYFDSTSNKDIQSQEKIATCDAFMAYVKGVGSDAQQTLHELANLNAGYANSEQGIHLMTIHKSKGLEFNLVLVSGLQEGRFPYYEEDVSAIDKQAALELASERRLFYVAITRAKQKLVILEAPNAEEHKRMKLGEIPRAALKHLSLSRFVFEAQPYAVSQICKALGGDSLDGAVDTEKAKVFQRYLNTLAEVPEITFRQRIMDTKSLLKSGDKVRHEQFGQGVVVRQDQDGKQMITVDFGEMGLKRFNPKYTQLVKISSRT